MPRYTIERTFPKLPVDRITEVRVLDPYFYLPQIGFCRIRMHPRPSAVHPLLASIRVPWRDASIIATLSRAVGGTSDGMIPRGGIRGQGGAGERRSL